MAPNTETDVRCRVAADDAERQRAFDLRLSVFCDEQGVDPEAEFDGLDGDAIQIVALDGDDKVVGTCRVLVEGGECRIGRMAVRKARRKEGIGAKLVATAEAEAIDAGARRVTLHAQRSAEHFYAGCGYLAEGPTFEEEGIPHVLMTKVIG